MVNLEDYVYNPNFFWYKERYGDRCIIVVGLRTKEKSINCTQTIIGNKTEIISKNIKEIVFKLGHSICHPNDECNTDLGIEIAIRNLKKSKRKITANSYSLLGNDRCMNIVKDEAEFIGNNIEKYIKNYN